MFGAGGRSTGETSDAHLVERAREGDTRAYTALVARHGDSCWRFAYRMLGHRADAEDAVQNTWLRVCRGWQHYKEQGSFQSWLFQILVNECRTMMVLHRREKARFEDGDEALERIPTRNTNDTEIQDTLQNALAVLDPSQREAVLLKFGEGLTYEEMAVMLSCSIPALKMRVSRGREILRRHLHEEVSRENER